MQLITAEYEELPAVYDEVEALTSNVFVHDELKPAGTFADLKHLKDAKNTNLALDYRLRRGDFDKAYAAAAHKFEHEFRTQKVLHLSFEPFACICDYKDTHVTFYNSSQGPSFVRTEIARLLGWPENKVRIKVPYLGSGYGSKLYIKLEALALALSMIARKPVKVAYTFEEMFYQITRHPSTFRIKSGVDKDGRIVARKCEVFWNGGAYADIGPRVTQKSGLTASGPYDIDNRLDQFLRALHQRDAGRRAARLRRAAAGVGLRGPHRHDGARAEARSGRVPPQEPRARGTPARHRPGAEGRPGREGDGQGARAHELVASRSTRAAAARSSAAAASPSPIKAVISPTTSVAIVNVSADGSATLYCGTIDMGQGSDTAMAQMVGEVLNIPAEAVRVVAARHRRDALRHGHARLALAVPHGPRGAPRRRGRARQAESAGQGGRRAGGLQHPDRRAVPEALRHAGRQRHRLAASTSRTTCRPRRAPARARTSRRSG